METVGIVSPGAMGSALGAALARGGARVVATTAGRSERTAKLAARASLELLPSLGEVVRASEVVLSVVPPGEAAAVAHDVRLAAGDRGPLFVELNAIAPVTVRTIAAESGLEVVDGSISGPPPWRAGTTRVYLSGPRADEVATLPFEGVATIVAGSAIGAASAVKMSTASVYKGTSALLAHALLAAHANGVLDHVLADLRTASPELVANVGRRLGFAASKAERYVAEMHEIAAAQDDAGLTPALFEALAEVFDALARSDLARRAPEEIDPDGVLEQVLDALRPERRSSVRE